MPKKETIYQARYDASNTTRISLKLNNKTDADIIAAIEKAKESGSIQSFIKSAIRAGMKERPE